MQLLQIKTSTARIAARITATDIGGIGIDTETTTTMMIAVGTGSRNMTEANFGVGTPITIDTSLRVSPSEIACRLGLRGSLCFAARFRQTWKAALSLFPSNLSVGFPLRRPIANESPLEGTLC